MNKFHFPPLLQNSLIRLRLLIASDFEPLFAIASDPLIWEQHPDRERYKREVFQKYFDGALESGSAYMIYDAVTDELIGCSRFYNYDEADNSIAVGYTFLIRKCWGGKYNRACKKLMLDHAFGYVDKVYLHIGPNNIRSQKAALKIGAVPTGETLASLNGSADPNLVFCLARDGWQRNEEPDPPIKSE